MTDPSLLRQMIEQLRSEHSDRLHNHGKHISRLEGIMQERHRENVESRRELGDRINRLDSKLDKIDDKLDKVVAATSENRGKIVLMVAVSVAIGGAAANALIQGGVV